jgi:2-polyprenyl-3-methyl-5-hydroxy-6-metoxy-1,4-benzoquinol methylase
VTRLDRLDALYSSHHKAKEGFTFGAEERASTIASLVGGPGVRILDLGCRDGALTKHYATSNIVTGMDVDREALHRAEKRLGIETIWADVEEPFPFPCESFDVVVAGELLEHVAQPAAVVGEARRVLTAPGAFVGSVPNAFRLKGRLRFMSGRQPETDATHLHLFTTIDLRTLLLASFAHAEIKLAVGRYARYHPGLMARDQIFRATGRASVL